MNYKIVIVIPAGRKGYLEVLLPQLFKYSSIVDEYRLWLNTKNISDIKYMTEVRDSHPELNINLEHLLVPWDGCESIYSFFSNCIDEDTVYVRFDDDILVVDDLDAFKKFLKFRIENPSYFLVFGNILNNNIINHIHQRLGHFSSSKYVCDYDCTGNYWRNGMLAELAHQEIIDVFRKKGNLKSFYFDKPWILCYFERVSINCISFMGKDFRQFWGVVGRNEEQWLSTTKPKELGRHCCIYGEFVVVHYAFFPQRKYLDTTKCYATYRELLRI